MMHDGYHLFLLENYRLPWDHSAMIATTDEKKRVMIPSAEPGERFDIQLTPEGKVILTRLDAIEKQETVRLVKKHGYTVAQGTRPITQEQVRRALDEFP